MVLVYSGGLDSTCLLYERSREIKLALTFNYGSKHNAKEIECARLHCQRLGIEHRVIDLPFIAEHFKSALLTGDVPDGHYEDEVMKKTVVPFRNGIMLSIAVGIAESYGHDKVLLASHAGDHAIYPDCRPEFNRAFTNAARSGTYNEVELDMPYSTITKRQVVERTVAAIAHRTAVLIFLETWSCYKGRDIHCGTCGTCVERKEALEGYDLTKYLK